MRELPVKIFKGISIIYKVSSNCLKYEFYHFSNIYLYIHLIKAIQNMSFKLLIVSDTKDIYMIILSFIN